MICLDFFLDIVGAVSAADPVAASLTEKFFSIGRGGGEKLRRSNTGLGILVLVAIDLQRKLGRSCNQRTLESRQFYR